jgi:hypothetical protein
MGSQSTCRVVYNGIPTLRQDLAQDLEKVCSKVTEDMLADMQASMRGIKSGRTYQRGKNIHVASKPGEPPAIDYGALVNSFWRRKLRPWVWLLGAAMEYALFLEFGTRKMEARPFFEVIVRKYRPIFDEAVTQVIQRATRRASR